MNKTKLTQISTPHQQASFNQELAKTTNHRIIFSAPFGTGKTTFLKDFFELSENKKKYKPIFVFPVNYSVASNDGIFELIKYDILAQMFHWENFENYVTDLSTDLAIYSIAIQDPMKIITPIVKAISELGGPLGTVAKLGQSLLTLKDSLKQIAAKQVETNIIHDFMAEIEAEVGSIYQKDIVTDIIKSILKKHKELYKGVQFVLIIDDLDRIDPDHLFRILNVFAAHNDTKSAYSNKFSFDKIITVFDVENAKHIFQSKYGDKTDFEGYISKFYSENIYRFNIGNEITHLFDKIFNINGDSPDQDKLSTYESRQISPYYLIYPVAAELLTLNLLTIRQIQQINFGQFQDSNLPKYVKKYNDVYIKGDEGFCKLYSFLMSIYKTDDVLLETLDKAKNQNILANLTASEFGGSIENYRILTDYIALFHSEEDAKNGFMRIEPINLIVHFERREATLTSDNYIHVLGARKISTLIYTQGKYEIKTNDIEFNIWSLVIPMIHKVKYLMTKRH